MSGKGSAPNDGRGEGGPKGITPGESVDKNVVMGGTGGGESKGGKHIEMHGPNPGTGHVKTGGKK